MADLGLPVMHTSNFPDHKAVEFVENWQARIGATDGQVREAEFPMHFNPCIVAPTGEIVAQAVTEKDELITFECDLDQGAYLRETTFNFARHRRVEHYGLITERTGVVMPPE